MTAHEAGVVHGGIPRYRRIHKRPGFVGLESYSTTDPGDCHCGHTLPHHGPEAIGRPCDRAKCKCAGFLSASGVEPYIHWSAIGWNGER